jgi:hypothetical protein
MTELPTRAPASTSSVPPLRMFGAIPLPPETISRPPFKMSVLLANAPSMTSWVPPLLMTVPLATPPMGMCPVEKALPKSSTVPPLLMTVPSAVPLEDTFSVPPERTVLMVSPADETT